MRIEVKGRNLPVSDEASGARGEALPQVGRQVSELAELEVEVFEERNPAIADSQIAEATLHLKGVTLRARDASPDIIHSINMVSDELSVQVKRHRDKRRKRRESRAVGTAPAAAGRHLAGGVGVMRSSAAARAFVMAALALLCASASAAPNLRVPQATSSSILGPRGPVARGQPIRARVRRCIQDQGFFDSAPRTRSTTSR